MKITAVVINLSFATLLGFIPSAERIAEVMPYLQASGFAAMAVNNGLQVAKQMKGDEWPSLEL